MKINVLIVDRKNKEEEMIIKVQNFLPKVELPIQKKKNTIFKLKVETSVRKPGSENLSHARV